MPKPLRLAALDLGSNAFRMAVAEADPATGAFRILRKSRETVRLAAGGSLKRLSGAAMGRGIAVLKRFRKEADAWRAPVRAVATSAVREALNRGTFLERVRREAGIRVEVVTGTEEARLIHLGVLQGLPLGGRTLLLVDVGGGSTEILLAHRREVLYARSLKMGAVRFSPLGPGACREAAAGLLVPVARALRGRRFSLAVGTAGTVTALARMAGEPVLERRVLERLVRRLESGEIPPERDRADILPAGARILSEVFRALGIRRMRVSEYGLREGLILDTLERRRGRPFGRVPDVRRAGALAFARRCGTDLDHARHVARLSLALFDASERLHGLGLRERDLLEAAALLHDVGTLLSEDQHHRHGEYLIQNADLPGYTDGEKAVLACVARYHRKSHPKPRHEGFSRLDARDRGVVRALASLLRIADALDRAHDGRVRKVLLRSRGRAWTLRTPGCSDLARWAFEGRKGLFEETFGVRLRLAP